MKRWSGRVAMVTGASAGIGAAIAEELVKNGMKVVGLARRVERVEALAVSLESESGKLYPINCDINQESEVIEAFKWVKENLGGVDVLINNAGVASRNKLTEGPTENWRKILDLNVLALCVCTKEAFQSMKERGVEEGHIIHINSVFGHVPPHQAFLMYGASKHAITALTEGLRRELVELKSKIRVTSVSPGAVQTEIFEASRFTEEEIKSFGDITFLQPKEIADAILYVLGTPPHVQIHELTIRPVGEVFRD